MKRPFLLWFLAFSCYLPSPKSALNAQDLTKISSNPFLGEWVSG
jgi:hypothetical protein